MQRSLVSHFKLDCTMLRMWNVLMLCLCFHYSTQRLTSDDLEARLSESLGSDHLDWLLVNIVAREQTAINCLAVISDPYYTPSFSPLFFHSVQNIPVFLIKVQESEDLLAPNYQTVKTIQQVRHQGCTFYIILLTNGNQAVRLLRFGDKYRLLDTRARFVLLHDPRLLEPTAQFLWNKMINVVFLRSVPGTLRYELSTVHFPAQIQTTLVPMRINFWRNGHFQTGKSLFPDKTRDMKGHAVSVVTIPHIPSTTRSGNTSGIYREEGDTQYNGLEVEIIKSLSQAMNFVPLMYEVEGGDEWGERQLDGSYTGLLGEVMGGRAQLAIGNLQHSLYTLRLVDLSRPYMTQCFTFLTPESRSDNSWQTLILPFWLNVWVPVLITLFLGGFIFFSLAQFHRYLENSHQWSYKQKHSIQRKRAWMKNLNLAIFSLKKKQSFNRRDTDEESGNRQGVTLLMDQHNTIKESQGLFIFEELENSILYTYGMLVSISLPKMPTGWALRIMTGWWWFYCLLVVVSYRASLTAILAKPEPKVTIDTLNELINSPVRCGGWGEPERLFFTTSFDPDIHKIGLKFETIPDADRAVDRVASGTFAYYENSYFLLEAITRYWARTQNSSQSEKEENKSMKKRNLHIMSDCIILMPISIGLEKNSPLKPRIDEFIQRVVEAGLIHKWLRDVMEEYQDRYLSQQIEQVQALVNLRKFSGAFIALGVGYGISLTAFMVEVLHWHFVIRKDPLFDKYSMSQFYFCKKLK